jgi:menaquinol-cytochrome c reductase iron-sulfur subunit
MSDSSSRNVCCCSLPAAGDTRRGFVTQGLAILLGGLALLPSAAVALIAFFNPLRQRGQAGDFMKVASLSALPEDNTPRKFLLLADRVDAWNRSPNEPIGAVYLRRVTSGKVEALQVICPHAGCAVGYEASAGRFFCPCHSASFDLAGKRTDATSPSPRDMDGLEVQIRNQNEVWVKFQNFRTGTPQKVAQA